MVNMETNYTQVEKSDIQIHDIHYGHLGYVRKIPDSIVLTKGHIEDLIMEGYNTAAGGNRIVDREKFIAAILDRVIRRHERLNSK